MILLTGASGFVGRAVKAALERQKKVRLVLRNPSAFNFQEEVDVLIASLSIDQDWSKALDKISTVIHCAARVHIMKEKPKDSLSEFRLVNVEGTLNLARQAAKIGVKRFIFISSIGVNGGETFATPFTADDYVRPHTSYAISKYEAEARLRELAKETGMEVVIIRPPLVYGPDAPGNFLSLMKWLSSGIPLPLGGVATNMRSFVYIDNLVDLIIKCIDHPAAANQIFLVSDGEDVSTATLLRKIATALGRSNHLINIPVKFIKYAAEILGRPDIASSICGSLQVDMTKTKSLLGWLPPISMDEGLRRTAARWMNQNAV